MKRITSPTIILATLLTLTGCAGPGQPGIPKEMGGTLIGSAVGGLLGSNFGEGNGKSAAIVTGVLLGGFVGNRVGAYMDETDRMRAQQAMQSYGESHWRSQSGGNYSVNKPYLTQDGRLCRRINFTDNSGALIESSACCSRMVDSRCQAWRMVN